MQIKSFPMQEENPWEAICWDIIHKKCIPIIGAGASAPWFPLADDVTKEWAQRFDYPEGLPLSLAAVAQFVATSHKDVSYPKKILSTQLAQLYKESHEVFWQADFGTSIYGVLAKLELPIYVTTNYCLLYTSPSPRDS